MIQELERLAPLLIGPGAGVIILVILAWFNRQDAREAAAKFEAARAAFDARLEKKDEELRKVATESIGAITQLTAIGAQNQQWQTKTSETLQEIAFNVRPKSNT